MSAVVISRNWKMGLYYTNVFIFFLLCNSDTGFMLIIYRMRKQESRIKYMMRCSKQQAFEVLKCRT